MPQEQKIIIVKIYRDGWQRNEFLRQFLLQQFFLQLILSKTQHKEQKIA